MTDGPSSNLLNIKDDLGIELPVKTIRDFLYFEKAVAASEEKKRALVIIF